MMRCCRSSTAGWPHLARSRSASRIAPLVISLVALLWGAGAAAARAQSPFADELIQWYGPSSAVAGDLNEDGRTDLVAGAYWGDHERLVYLQANGDGSYSAQTLGHLLPAQTYAATSIRLADMDGDGHLDIVACLNAKSSSGTNWIVIVRGLGNGTFVSLLNLPESIGSNHRLTSVVVGRFDTDLDTDFAVAVGEDTAVEVFFNDGIGGVGGQATVPTTIQPVTLTSAHLNNDARDDLLVTGYELTSMVVVTSSGSTAWSTSTLAYPGAIGSVAAADFGTDGLADLAVLYRDPLTFTSYCQWSTNLGSGTFGSPTSTISRPGFPRVLQTGALNGDGYADLLVVTWFQDEYEILPLLSTGSSFQVAPELRVIGEEVGLVSPLHDVDADGDKDLMLCTPGGFLAASGDGTGKLALETSHVTLGVGNGSSGNPLVHADLDGDGFDDIIESNNTQPYGLYVYWGSASAPFTTGYSWPAFDPSWLGTAELNGDQAPDVIMSSAGIVRTFINNGSGIVFAQPDVFLSEGVSSLVVGDLNSDRREDVVAISTGSPTTVLVILTQPGGGLGPPTQIASPAPVKSVALGDATMDGNLDLLVGVAANPSGIYILPGNGNGTFGSPLSLVVAPGSNVELNHLVSADVNFDGRRDLLASGYLPGAGVTTWLATGPGTFGPASTTILSHPSTEPIELDTTAMLVEDVTGDGAPDVTLVVRVSFSGLLVVLPGGGDGTWLSPLVSYAGNTTARPGLFDVDGDEIPDATVMHFHNHLHRFLNTTTSPTWLDLQHALAGKTGMPQLQGKGALVAGSPGKLVLTNARPSALCTMHVSISSTPKPFKQGVLVPFPPLMNISLFTNAAGSLVLPFTWPNGVPSGSSMWFQVSVADPAAVAGVALSNALKIAVP